MLPRAQRIARAAGYASAVLIAGLGAGCAESRSPEADAATPASDAAVVADAHVDEPDAAPVADAGTDAAMLDAGPENDADVPVPLYGGAFPDPRRRAVI